MRLQVLVIAFVLGCGPDSSTPGAPAGTSADPAETCTRPADVCRLDGPKLGVCTQARTGNTLICASQH